MSDDLIWCPIDSYTVRGDSSRHYVRWVIPGSEVKRSPDEQRQRAAIRPELRDTVDIET